MLESFELQCTAKNWFFYWPFYVPITNFDILCFKSLYTVFDKYLDLMLVKFEQNRIVRNKQIFGILTTNGQQNLKKCWRHFTRCYFDINNCLVPIYSVKDYHISCFPKIENCYGRPIRFKENKLLLKWCGMGFM